MAAFNDDIYDDNDVVPVFQKAPALYEPLKDKKVVTSLWFRGNVDRAQAEREIMDDSVPGNFLVRQKDKSSRLFAHSYLSRTKQKVVHNLIELQSSGEWNVDGQPFSAVGLDDLVDQLQARLKRWRKLADPSPRVRDDVFQFWSEIYLPHLNRDQATMHLAQCCDGSFLLRSSSTPNCLALSVKRGPGAGPQSVYNGMIVQSQQGWYLKFSELVGNTLEELIMIMISNPDRLVSTGVPHALVLPMFQQLPTDVYDDLDGMTLDGNAVGAHQQQNDWDDDPDDDYPPPIPDGRPQGQNEFENDEAIYDSSEEPESYSTKQEDLYDSNDDLNQGDCIYDEAEFPDEEPVLPPRNDESFDNDYDDEDFSDDDEVPPPPPVARNAPKPIDTISVQHDALYSDDEDFSDDDVPPPVVRRNEPPPPPIVGRGGGSDGGAPPILGRAGSGDVDRNRYGMPDDNLEDDGPPPVLPPSRGKPAMPPPTEEFDDDFDVDDDDDSPPIPGRPPVRPPARHGSDEPRGNLPPLPPKPR